MKTLPEHLTVALIALVPALALAQAKPAPPPAAEKPAAKPAPPPAAEKPPDKPADKSKAEPPAAEAGEAAPSAAEDYEALRKEYDSLREGLFTSRARAAAVADTLYSAKILVTLRWRSARFQSIRRATIRLDGASVYDDTQGAIGENDAPRFEGFVAPGTHAVTIRIEAQGKDDERFVSTLEDTFTVDAVAGKVLVLRARAEDGGDMAWAWRKKQKGSYKLRLEVSAETQERKDRVKTTAGRTRP